LDASIAIWNVASGTCESDVQGASGWILAAAFEPAGKYFVTGGYNRKMQVWDPTNAQVLKTLALESAVRDLAFSHDGVRLLAGCVDGQMRMWHTNDWTPLPECPRFPVPVNAASFSPDGSCFAGGSDGGEIRLWAAADCRELGALTFHSSQIMKLVFSPRGNILFSSAANGDIAIWSVAQRKLLQTFHQHGDEVTGLVWLTHQQAIATVGADGAQLVRFARLPPVNVQALGETAATWTALSKDGQMLVHTDGVSEIRLTDLAGKMPVRTIAAAGTRCMVVTAADHLLAVGTDRRIREWELASAALVSESPPLNDEVVCLDAASDCRRIAIGTTNRAIQLVDITTLTNPIVRWSTPAQALRPSRVVFSPDGKWIATATHDPLNWRAAGEVKLWDSETGVEIAEFGPHSAEVSGVCFDPAGRCLASFGSFSDLRLWSVDTRKELPRLPTRAQVAGAAFTHDGKRIVVAESTGPVSVWSLQRQMPVCEFDGHGRNVATLVSSHDRKLVVTRDVSNQARFWKVPDE
jgi:WD40 repeat protein